MTTGVPIIITGVARGGTSLIAAMCYHLGLPLGKAGPRYENPYLQWAATQGKWDAVAKMGEILSEHHVQWGWKLPILHRHLNLIGEMFPQALFLLVFKDPVSVSLRKATSHEDAMIQLDRTVAAYRLMSSYSRANPERCEMFGYSEVIRDFGIAATRISNIIGGSSVDVADLRLKIDQEHVRYREGYYVPRVRSDIDRILSSVCTDYGVSRPAKLGSV